MPFCRCQEVTLYYETHGEGPALLLVSGLGGGSWSWYGQVPFFAKRYRTIIFDNRGAGRSTMPKGPYRMSQLADEARFLLDHLGVDKTFVLGLSMGGMIAQQLALQIPRRIRAMFLGCTHAGGASLTPPTRAVMDLLMNNAGLTQRQVLEKNIPLFSVKDVGKPSPRLSPPTVRLSSRRRRSRPRLFTLSWRRFGRLTSATASASW